MEVLNTAIAGTLESSDALVRIEPNDEEGIVLEVSSVVEKQFGEEIQRVVLETIKELEVRNVTISITDRGALNCTLRARVQTAVLRGAKKELFN
jgi:citrate lyase subunit gamma (acyl carrier protein)